jgi:hypothetical protein
VVTDLGWTSAYIGLKKINPAPTAVTPNKAKESREKK